METSRALVGLSLEEATRTGFFQWFNLEPAAQLDAHRTAFKPSGPNFRDLVAVTVLVSEEGRITAIDLALARSFIEDPRQGMFAADLAKSFLAAALEPADRAHMQHLIDTIAYGGRYARPILVRPDNRPEPQLERDSAPYQVWLGRNRDWRRPFDAVLLRLENVEIGGAPLLRIAVSSQAEPDAQASASP